MGLNHLQRYSLLIKLGQLRMKLGLVIWVNQPVPLLLGTALAVVLSEFGVGIGLVDFDLSCVWSVFGFWLLRPSLSTTFVTNLLAHI